MLKPVTYPSPCKSLVFVRLVVLLGCGSAYASTQQQVSEQYAAQVQKSINKDSAPDFLKPDILTNIFLNDVSVSDDNQPNENNKLNSMLSGQLLYTSVSREALANNDPICNRQLYKLYCNWRYCSFL